MEEYQTDANGQPYGETELALLRLHSNLIDFYSKHNPEKVDEEVLTILMQFFIDAGGVALNKKLQKKYGEDLQTFERAPKVPPHADDVDMTMKRLSRISGTKQLQDEYDMKLPPAAKTETNFDPKEARKSVAPMVDRPRKKKKINDPELLKYKASKQEEADALLNDIDEIMFGSKPKEDLKLKLFLLDKPDDKPLTPRDLIEAFYSKHDESKLDTSVDKFVKWVKNYSLQKLSEKLEKKYHEGLLSSEIKSLARRRRNLENLLTAFYMKHDTPKLETRWTILKILSWTMNNGIPSLNKKFITRYGFVVVETDPKKKRHIPTEDELEI